ncbi:hypothetical protein MOSE0_N03290 [Monosporozyma servazzii]
MALMTKPLFNIVAGQEFAIVSGGLPSNDREKLPHQDAAKFLSAAVRPLVGKRIVIGLWQAPFRISSARTASMPSKNGFRRHMRR